MDENIKFWFVIDSSYLLSFLLPDEDIEEVNNIFGRLHKGDISFISTDLLPFEVLNGLKMSVRRKRITKLAAERLVDKFFGIEIDLHPVDMINTFLLAEKLDITVYDASYLQLSLENKIPLLTLDEKLQRFSTGLN